MDFQGKPIPIAVIRNWTMSCPACGKLFRAGTGMELVRLGPEVIKCGNAECLQGIRTGEHEWVRMTKWQKIGYFFSSWTVAIIFLVLLVGLGPLVSAAIKDRSGYAFSDDLVLMRYTFIIGAVVLAPSLAIRIVRIRASLRRTSSEAGPLSA
jgi:hypothetical protein